MKTYIVEYTTDRVNRFTTTITALDYTKAFLAFTFAYPASVMIVDITERG